MIRCRTGCSGSVRLYRRIREEESNFVFVLCDECMTYEIGRQGLVELNPEESAIYEVHES